MRRLPPALLSLLLVAGPAAANDSSGYRATTGIELARNDAISMVSEDLRVGLDRIAVDYVFRNRTAAPVTTLVVFPLPDIDLSLDADAANWSFPEGADGPDFLGFQATVDGKAVRFETEVTARRGGRDVMGVLRRAGLGSPGVLQGGEAASAAIAALPAGTRAELRRAGLIGRDPHGNGGDVPAWTLRVRHHWEQTFPAGADLRVSHTYRPFVGGGVVGDSVPIGGAGRLDGGNALGGDGYCMDAGTRAAAVALVRRSRGAASTRELAYILTTARNWSGPIGRFRLTLDKGRADRVLSLCWRGALRRSGPTTYTFEATDFIPSQDIRLMIVQGPET